MEEVVMELLTICGEQVQSPENAQLACTHSVRSSC